MTTRQPERYVAGLGAVAAAIILVSVGMAEDFDNAKMRTHALATWNDIGAPVGRFLLVRKDSDLCGIRFTEYDRGRDARPPTVFSSGEESLDAKYECVCQGQSGGGFGALTRGEVKKRASWGIGRLAFGGGDMNVRCGRFELAWMYPTRVSFQAEGARLGDYGIEMAPTRWSTIGEVNVRDVRLRWFRYDESRKVTWIPADDL